MKAHKNSWYKEWHQWRLSHHFHVAMLTLYIIIVVMGSFGMFFTVTPKKVLASTPREWTFSTPNEYTYTPGEIEITGGVAQPLGYNTLDSLTQGIECTDESTCYVVGNNGKIFKTTNGGANWTSKTAGSSNLSDIHCIDGTSTCYTVAVNSRVYKTIDGGTTWVGQYFGTSNVFYDISCTDVDTCYIAAQDAIFKTSNGGADWDYSLQLGFGGNLESIYCLGISTCYAVGQGGSDVPPYTATLIYKTDNGGAAWTPQSPWVSGGPHLSDVYCTDTSTCYAVGELGAIYKTSNGGVDWGYQNPGTSVWLDSIHCPVAGTCYVVSRSSTVLKTADGGINWDIKSSAISANAINCPNDQTCYVGGNQGHSKTMNAGLGWIGLNYYPMPTVIPNGGQNYSIITGFKENLGAGSTGTIYYQISNDNGDHWYWYNGTSWTATDNNYDRNTASEINSNILNFTGSYGGGTGQFKWKAIYYATALADSQKLDSIQISVKGNSPNKPQSLTISDVSNREKGVWALALSWDAPDPGGTEIDFFKIERSENGGPWQETDRTSDETKRAYAEVVESSSSTYAYRVRSVDHDDIGGLYDDESEASNEVSMIPTGKFPSLPSLLTSPSISATATTANISWSTDRVSSSTVKYGTDTDYGLTASDYQTEVTSHGVSLKGLLPGTTYHYKIQSLDPERTYGDDVYYPNDYTFTTSLAAEISGLKVTEIRSDNALLSWQTTSDMASTVYYGKTTEYGSSVETSGGISHTLRLNGLGDATTYHLKIIGKDAGGNLVQSDDYSFETLAYPKISNVRFEPIKDRPTSTLKAIWDTNIPTSSVVGYTDMEGKTQEVSEYQMATKHEIIVSDLKDKVDYMIVVKGRDAFGNEVSSERQKISTDIDTRPPEISEITVETSINGYGANAKSQMIVSWSTDEAATSQVEYSKGGSGKTLNVATQEDSSLTTSHAVIIPNLEPSSSYYFRIISKDNSRNETKSEIKSALTDRIRLSVFDIMLKSFASSFDWLFGAKRLN